MTFTKTQSGWRSKCGRYYVRHVANNGHNQLFTAFYVNESGILEQLGAGAQACRQAKNYARRHAENKS